LVFKASRGIEDIYELTYIRKDGSRFPAVVSVTALRDAQNAIIGYLLIGTDNTARKQAEEALLKAGALQRAIFNSANFSSIATDATGVIQIFNVGAERMLGYSAAEVMNKITPADISDPQEVIARATALSVELATPITPGFEALVFKASRGIEDIYELTYIRKDGSRFPAVVSVTALRDAQNAIIGYLLIGSDNTARKQASQYVRSLIEASLDPLVTISAEGKITDVNEGLIKVTGMARGKLIGTDFSDYFTEPEKARGGYQQVFAKGFVTDYPLTIRHQDGRLTHVLYNASVYRDVSGNVLGVFAAARDVTDRKRAEKALIEAKEHAEAASKAKDNFLAALSHELRTPLTPVLMTATALASDPTLPAEVREQLDMMRRNIELEARLIDDLLDLTRIIHGKLIIAPVTADIHELLHHTDEIIRSDCLGKKLSITLKLDAARHHALADPARLQQVFWNLLRNAVKFTPDDGTITVSTRNNAEGGIIISVADDGIGIRAEVLAQIFDAFEQADTTGEHRYGGLGLGLAISSAIVTAHGGEIKAESQGCGEGAEFTVILDSVPAPVASSLSDTAPTQPVRALSLLVVEDHESTRTVLERLLTRSGHLVVTAATVHDALAAYKAAHFDAVISDLGLPDGSGIDLMVQIQNIRPVPAIALSGYGMEDDLHRSKAAGFFAHLVKPVKVEQLKQLLTQIPARAGHLDNA
jgi:PAS domain S-box-containing protein